ncbi:MAG: DUF302 domain-containing protein [Campylobacterales bacterium]|nr:DUF302 domain-containing protein [Campylobacterales bacterium]
MKKILLVLFLLASSVIAADNIYKIEVNEEYDVYYPKLKKELEINHINVISEMDLIQRFTEAGYAKKFGKNFNKNNIEKATSLILCNGYIGNQVSNIDVAMMAFCPIRLTVLKQGNKTIVLYVKSAPNASNPEVVTLLNTLDEVVINTVNLTKDAYMQKAYSSGFEPNNAED